MSENLLIPSEDYAIEPFSEFEMRYSGFGKDFYARIQEELPEIYEKLVIKRHLNREVKDSFAEYNSNDISFAIQLDPVFEVIVLWNKKKAIEIGTWSENELDAAISYIKTEFIDSNKKSNLKTSIKKWWLGDLLKIFSVHKEQ